MRKVKMILSLKPSTALLLLEAFLYLGLARGLKRLPFSKLAITLGEQMKETPFITSNEHADTLKKISHAVQIMSAYTFWESECLVKAIACQKMLKRRNIENTLYLGTAKDSSGELIAHAWLRSGLFYLSGSEGMEKFTVVAKFSMTRKQAEGENYGSYT